MGLNPFNIINIVLGVCVIISAVMAFAGNTWRSFLWLVSVIYFGLLIILAEVKFPQPFLRWYPFFGKWLGEGIFLFFVGCLVMFTGVSWCAYNQPNHGGQFLGCYYCWGFGTITGWACIGFGVAYVVTHFIKCVERPPPMQGEGGGSDCAPCAAQSGCNCPPIIINILLIIGGVCIVISAIWRDWGCLISIVWYCIVIFLGVMTILHEINWPAPLPEYMGWFDDFLGEGIFFVIMSLLVTYAVDRYFNWFIMGMGIFMIVAHILGCPQKPPPMQGGGASGDYGRF